jgi:alpha-galactosidase/6-phospho-beta-glucosidase family protein
MREAPTIVLIGAGSASFGLTMLHDLYADPELTGPNSQPASRVR